VVCDDRDSKEHKRLTLSSRTRCLILLSQLLLFGLLVERRSFFFLEGAPPFRDRPLFLQSHFSVIRGWRDGQRGCEVISYSIKRAILIGNAIDIGECNSRNRLTSIKSLIAGAHALAHAHARSRARTQRRHAGSFMRVNICVGLTSTSANKTHDCGHKLI